MRTGRGRRGWARARYRILPKLHSLVPTGRSTGAAGLSQRTARRMVGRNGLLYPNGADAQQRRGSAHNLESDSCRARMRRGRARAHTAVRDRSFGVSSWYQEAGSWTSGYAPCENSLVYINHHSDHGFTNCGPVEAIHIHSMLRRPIVHN
jgi:hypothetical protein